MGQRDKKRLESKNDPKDKQQEPGTSKALGMFEFKKCLKIFSV